MTTLSEHGDYPVEERDERAYKKCKVNESSEITPRNLPCVRMLQGTSSDFKSFTADSLSNTEHDIFRFERRLKKYRLDQYKRRRRRQEQLAEEESLTDHEDDDRGNELRRCFMGAVKRPIQSMPRFAGIQMSASEDEMKRKIFQNIEMLQRQNDVLRQAIREKLLKDLTSTFVDSAS